MLQRVKNRQQVWANRDDALGLKGAPNTRDRCGQMDPENMSHQRVGERGLRRALNEMGQQETAPLELRENSVGGLPFRGKLNSFENLASFALKASFGRVEEI